MTRSQLEYILALDKTRSFSKAADSCFVTQSTLSAMVAKFEKQINITIFDRKTKPINITTEGELVLKHLKNIKREFEVLDETVSQIKGIQTGVIRIAAIPTIAPYLFPNVLKILAKKYPEVHFLIHEITTQKIVEEILSGNIDVGVVALPLEEKELVEIPLYEEVFMLYDRREEAKQTDEKVDVDSIDLKKLLLMEEGHCFRNQVIKICNLRQIESLQRSITYYSGSIESLKKMVELNKGVTLLPYLSTLGLCPETKSCLREFVSPAPARQIGLIRHKNFVKKELLNGLKEVIINEISKEISKSPVDVIKPF